MLADASTSIVVKGDTVEFFVVIGIICVVMFVLQLIISLHNSNNPDNKV